MAMANNFPAVVQRCTLSVTSKNPTVHMNDNKRRDLTHQSSLFQLR